jgi:hypothetical protein
MRAKSIIFFATAVVFPAGLTADASAFSGGVSHVVTHPVAFTPDAIIANPGMNATAATRRHNEMPSIRRESTSSLR